MIKKLNVLLLIILVVFLSGCSGDKEINFEGDINVNVTNPTEYNYSEVLITESFLLSVAMGEVPNAKLVHKFGRHEDVTTSIEPVSLSGNYRTPSTATQLQVVSNDVDDNSAGVGGRSILVQGLNSTWQEQEVEVFLDGTTPVILPINFTRVYRAYVTSSGTYASQTSASHEGTITIEEVGTGDDWAIINVDSGFALGQTQIGAYSIEKGCIGYLLAKFVNVDTTRVATGYFFQRQGINRTSAPYDTMRLVEQEDGIDGSLAVKPQSVIRTFPELTDIGFMAKTSQGTATMSVDFEVLLICDHVVQ